MAWKPDQLPDLHGRTALVTGANSGLGMHTARELAAHGADVVLACRKLDAGRAVASRIGARARAVHLDLASLDSVRAFGDAWDGPLHLLINNAGVMAPPKPARTADGFELQFGTNHLGHFVLTGLLLPALIASGAGRVVTVASIAHHSGDSGVLDANADGPYNSQRTYGNSKLANLLFADELNRRLSAHGLPVTSAAAHPGVAATGLITSRDGMGANPVVRTLGPAVLTVFTQTSRTGARAVLYAAAVADPGSYTGPRHFRETRGPVGPARRSAAARDEELAQQLWRASEELTGFRYAWDATPDARDTSVPAR